MRSSMPLALQSVSAGKTKCLASFSSGRQKRPGCSESGSCAAVAKALASEPACGTSQLAISNLKTARLASSPCFFCRFRCASCRLQSLQAAAGPRTSKFDRCPRPTAAETRSRLKRTAKSAAGPFKTQFQSLLCAAVSRLIVQIDTSSTAYPASEWRAAA
jgi:hypothetical protein